MPAADGSKLCHLEQLWAIVSKTAWQFLIDDPDRISSIGTCEWACAGL